MVTIGPRSISAGNLCRPTFSPVGMAAFIAALHLALASSRWPVAGAGRMVEVGLIWQAPAPEPRETGELEENAPSHPNQEFSAGRLALTTGMAVIGLTFLLHVMRLNGRLGR